MYGWWIYRCLESFLYPFIAIEVDSNELLNVNSKASLRLVFRNDLIIELNKCFILGGIIEIN